MGKSRTASTRDEAASGREVRSKWEIGLAVGGGKECGGGLSGEIGQAGTRECELPGCALVAGL